MKYASLSVLIVLYKQSLCDSDTFRSLCRNPDSYLNRTNLVVWDNSPKEYTFKQYINTQDRARFNDFKYINSKVNESLSVLYNKVIDDSIGSSECFILLDQDSEVPDDFLEKVMSVDSNGLLMVPRVLSRKTKTIISPRYQSFSRYFLIPEVNNAFNECDHGLKNSVDFFAVGSGMIIPKTLWNNGFRFNEKLRFYGVDADYCYSYSKVVDSFFLLDSSIYHDISEEDIEESSDMKKWRFEQTMDYFSYFLHTNLGIGKLKVTVLVLLRRILFYFKSFV
ncbi:glycosyltransferase [Vibrio parahaemolyticus]|uniref:glycosyltransferase n=1 Tax=Vibrio parahaemolyticus TaxID=670 RepID=UPI001A8CDBAB|nr:glycosyltransferase [Vibrio parahaemolyticus]EJB8540143.1 glycosyltransferase [Vibrio parahaemolyticus]MBO0186762.1 glycosyltransferase [Vibrio parahaemolyticus]MBO0218255.1 glycosyltransferase [Vibrio parahaemolyticus]MBY4624005.1 glycosyltransferase [Vibrio parahaemolyticus]MCR9736832.1 glycosyltransferase [Vibrio parahaemolyticus]